MEFTKKLREFRVNQDLSLAELAKLIDTAPSTLSKYENGEMSPKIDTLLSLCAIFNCTPNDLLGIDKTSSKFSPMTVKCATIIEEMTLPQKQWVYLTIDGLKTGFDNLDKSRQIRNDFIAPHVVK